MRLMHEALQTKRKSLDIRQTTAKYWLEITTSSDPLTSVQDLVMNRSIKLGKAEGALEEVNNMLTTTDDQRSETEPINTTKTDDLKRLDNFLQDRRRDLVTRHKTSKFCSNMATSGCTITTHVNLVINRSLKLGRADGALEEVNNVIDTIFNQRNNIKPTGSDDNNTSTGTLRTATGMEENSETKKATNSTTTNTVKDKHTSRGREGVKKRTTCCGTRNNCLKPNCGTYKNCKRMIKFWGDGKAKQACEGRKCETEQEDTEARNPPQTNTKNQEMNPDKEIATATQAMGKTHKNVKHPANTNPTENMVEANINNKKQDNTKKDRQLPPPPPGGTSKTMEDGAKPHTGTNKTPNPNNVILNRM